MKKHPLAIMVLSLLLFISTASASSSFATNSEMSPERMKKAGNVTGLSLEEIDNRISKLPDPLTSGSLFDLTLLKPTRLLDNVYFVGYVSVGSFIIKTSDGLILIDAMWTPNDAEAVIIPGMKELNLDPKDIKYVVITHGHADHYGAARYFEDKFGAKVLMSKADWEHIHNPDGPVLTDPFGNYSSEIPLPNDYIEVKDGQEIRLGDTSIMALVTPGHTPGSISLIFPVKDYGIKHHAALWGGTGLPSTREENQAYLASLNRFEAVANKAGVDVSLSTHPFAHHLVNQIEALKKRKSYENNPVVIGNDAFKEYIDTVLRKNVMDKLATY